jgi:hypothetical protein
MMKRTATTTATHPDPHTSPSDLPDLSGEPTATCGLCGAVYRARWDWEGKGPTVGKWVKRTAAEVMHGWPGRLGHAFFCQRATPEQRAMAGRNG